MDQTVAEFMAHIRRLEALTSPQTAQCASRYEEWMSAAKANGSTYLEALEYVIGMQHGGAH